MSEVIGHIVDQFGRGQHLGSINAKVCGGEGIGLEETRVPRVILADGILLGDLGHNALKYGGITVNAQTLIEAVRVLTNELFYTCLIFERRISI